MNKFIQMLDIGDLVMAKYAYSRKATQRFNIGLDDKETLVPKERDFVGRVVGKRSMIMSEYKYHVGKSFEDDFSQPYSTGKKEQVLLVCKNCRTEPLVVRECDLV